MKKSINGIRISEEMKQLIAHGKEKADIADYPAIEEYMRTNKTAHNLIEELSVPQYPLIDKAYKENQVNRFFQIIHKKQYNARRHRRIIFSVAATAAIIILSLLILPINEKENFENTGTLAINSTPTLILEDGSSIDLSKVNADSLRMIAPNTPAAGSKLTYNRITIPNHYTYHLTLDDGTEIHLNACTELKYPKTFQGAERVVELKGEAFFKVSKSSKPFIIKTKDTTIKVYGTAFNVLANSQITETILVEGSVGVTQNESGEEIFLHPNQRHTLRGRITTIESIDAANAIGWLNNEFNFSQIPVRELLTIISEWYGVSFDVALNDSEPITIDVCSPRTMKIEQLIEVMESSTDLRFIKETKNKFIVKRK